MKTDKDHINTKEYIALLASQGRYFFTSKEAQKSLGVSPDAAKLALNRLAKQTAISSPARGHYVIVPPEYRSLGCLPADQFIPSLMEYLSLPYYAGLLSAAHYHGAAHQRPQEFQVMLGKNRRPIHCGAVNVVFVARKRLSEVPVQEFNTLRGTLRVSTPEATAVDLIGYQHHAGGLDNVATVLEELAEKIDPEKLVAAARTAPLSSAQRLGYVLEQVGSADKAYSLKAYVKKHAKELVPLLPTAPHDSAQRNKEWKLYINTEVGGEE
ncbi:MAG: type IV toxin-antitoxin system AbiEi family antitoxin [Gammaproteobacteria bacterium]|nr:type IV toxin-antitoxin system AbiEi family antitoxin [Gammaproteobacteria bacterium]